jgi:hypothetical protein
MVPHTLPAKDMPPAVQINYPIGVDLKYGVFSFVELTAAKKPKPAFSRGIVRQESSLLRWEIRKISIWRAWRQFFDGMAEREDSNPDSYLKVYGNIITSYIERLHLEIARRSGGIISPGRLAHLNYIERVRS